MADKKKDTLEKNNFTVAVKIELACVAANIELVHFTFKEKIPRDVVEGLVPFYAWKKCQDALANHLRALIEKCEQIAFLTGDNWKCHACGKHPEIFYRGITYGDSTVKRGTSHKGRVLKVTFHAIAIPLCARETECEKELRTLLLYTRASSNHSQLSPLRVGVGTASRKQRPRCALHVTLSGMLQSI